MLSPENKMKNVYCIAGLGADEKIFSHIDWPEDVEVHYLKWVLPRDNEPIQDYARRMSEAVREPDPILVGASFGGMMSIEISRLIPVKKIVLISSITHYKEVPRWMRVCGKLKLDYLLPKRNMQKLLPLKIFYPVQNYFLGAQTPEARKMAGSYRNSVNAAYLKWSIHQILNWKNKDIQVPFVQIHGNRDKLFPISYVHPAYTIDKGGHFMVFQQAGEVSRLLNDVL